MDDLTLLLKAIKFSAEKHRDQRRKGVDASPYINHPIEVAEAIATIAGVSDPTILVAALLHDTVEDTLTKPEEIEAAFWLRKSPTTRVCTNWSASVCRSNMRPTRRVRRNSSRSPTKCPMSGT